MAGCNDECHCYLEGADGLVTDGLGTAEEPYTVGTDTGFHIPRAGTEAERTALVVDDDDQGLHFYETDTGRVYVYQGATFGWVAQSVRALEHAPSDVTLSAAVATYQTIATLALTEGTWALWSKCYVDASVDVAMVWTAELYDSTGAVILDTMNEGSTGSEQGAGVEPHYRAMPLQDMVTLAVDSTIIVRAKRTATGGTQVLRSIKLMAMSAPGTR